MSGKHGTLDFLSRVSLSGTKWVLTRSYTSLGPNYGDEIMACMKYHSLISEGSVMRL